MGEFLERQSESLPGRVAASSDAKGLHTKYSFFAPQFHMKIFLYLVNVYLNFQFIPNSCDYIDSKFRVKSQME